MSQSPNHVTLEKYIELMNNFVEVKTELVSKKDEILESRIEKFRNYVYLQKEEDAAILEERTRFDEVLVKIKENTEHLDKKINETSENMENKINKTSEHLKNKFIETSENMENKINENSEHLEKKINEISEHLEKKINETSERIDKVEVKIDDMFTLLQNIATHFNDMNHQYVNISVRVEKLEKEDKKSIDLPPVVSTQYDVIEQEVFIDDFIDKVKKLNLKDGEEKKINERSFYLNNYKLMIKFSVERYDDGDDDDDDDYDDIGYYVCVRLSIMKGDLDEVIKWPCEEIINVDVIWRDEEMKFWGVARFDNNDDKDKSWRNRVREGDIGEESVKEMIGGSSLKDYEDEILFGDKLKIKIEIK